MPYRRTHLFLQQNFFSETVFFFVLSLVTVLVFALLRELQNRRKTKNLIVFFLCFHFRTLGLMYFLMA